MYLRFNDSIRPGFSLIEITVVIVLLAIAGLIVVPRFGRVSVAQEAKGFAAQFEHLCARSAREASRAQVQYQVMFDLIQQKVLARPAPQAEALMDKISEEFTKDALDFPKNMQIKQLFIHDQDQLKRPGIKTQKAWFFIYPDGTAQPLIINSIFVGEAESKERKMSFTLNPFTLTVEHDESFQLP